MTLSPDARARINRENARKSTGPKTPEGKAAARYNALKHGLRAAPGALPNEDPITAPLRAAAWNDFYRPQSPEAHHLVNECVGATLLSDRLARYADARVSEQIAEAYRAWEDGRADAVEGHIHRL